MPVIFFLVIHMHFMYFPQEHSPAGGVLFVYFNNFSPCKAELYVIC